MKRIFNKTFQKFNDYRWYKKFRHRNWLDPDIRCLSSFDCQHWTAYYNTCPYDISNRYILTASYPSQRNAIPSHGPNVRIGIIDTFSDEYRILAESKAWCWQQGSYQQWLPKSKTEIIFNDLRDNGYPISVVLDTNTGAKRTLERPVLIVSPDGVTALGISYFRVNNIYKDPYRYGYNILNELRNQIEEKDENAGIFTINIKTGKSNLLISYKEILKYYSSSETNVMRRWCIAPYISFTNDGKSFAFAFLYESGIDGEPKLDIFISDDKDKKISPVKKNIDCNYGPGHFCWRNNTQLCIWFNNNLNLFDRTTGRVVTKIFRPIPDCHFSFKPDYQDIIVSDTYPIGFMSQKKQLLWLAHVKTKKHIILGKFSVPKYFHHAYSCDLHPNWSREGQKICFNSAHDMNGRQVYSLPITDKMINSICV